MGNIIYNEYENGKLNTAVLVATNGETVIIEKPYDRIKDEESPIDMNDENLFDFFDKLFGNQYSKITLVYNGEIYKQRERIFTPNSKIAAIIGSNGYNAKTLLGFMAEEGDNEVF